MKKHISIYICLLLCVTKAVAQNTPVAPAAIPGSATLITLPSNISVPNNLYNYTRTVVPRIPVTSISGSLLNASTDMNVVTTYTNGWGQPIQKNIRGNYAHQDVIIPYDNRPSKQSVSYLPFLAPTKSKLLTNPFTSQRSFYQGATMYPYEAGASYSLSNVSYPNAVPTANSYAPGKSYVGQGRGTTSYSSFNSVGNDIKILELDANGIPAVTGVYATATLTVNVTTQQVDDNSTISSVTSYTDKKGRLICKSVACTSNGSSTPMVTYYVYDDMDRVRYVITPEAVKQFQNISWAIASNQNILTGYCYKYLYDDVGNIIEKTNPDKSGTEYTVYDRKNRPVLYRSPLLAQQNKWAFTIYDSRGRVIMTGLLDAAIYPTYGAYTRAQWQNELNTATPTSSPQTLHDYLVSGYSGGAYPGSLSYCDIHTYNYYDTYDAYIDANNPTASQPVKAFNQSFSGDYQGGSTAVTPVPYYFTPGQLTASKTKILDGGVGGFAGQWISSVYYYDQKGHLIQTLTQNPWNTINWDVSTLQYNFTGQVMVNIAQHYSGFYSNKTSTKIVTLNEYNPITGQLQSVKQKLDNDANFRLLSAYTYDDLGRVIKKDIGEHEEQNYSYDIQGRMTGINAAYVNMPVANIPPDISFIDSMSYDRGFSHRRYDGRLTGNTWRTRSTPMSAYGFEYDEAGRLLKADYRDYSSVSGGAASWNKTNRDFSVAFVDYDYNGNMQHMQQFGPNQNMAPAKIDNLTYTYSGNRLLRVMDDGDNSPSLADFDNGASGTGNDYSYDENGNLRSDANKGITNISYNHQDLPLQVTTNNNSTISNIYDATGTLLQKTITNAGTSTTETYRYWGPFVYKFNTGAGIWELDYFLNSEGRSRWVGDSSLFKNDFFIKDHQGNVRTVTTTDQYTGVLDYLATHELVSASSEGLVFSNLESVRDDRPEGNPLDIKAAHLDGKDYGRRIGTSLAIHVMAGDKLKLNTYSYYEEGSGNEDVHAAAEDMISEILESLSGNAIAFEGGEEQVDLIHNLFNEENYFDIYDALKEQQTDVHQPRAYLNYLVFDEGMKLQPEYSHAWQIGSEPDQWNQIGMTDVQTIPFNGYVVAYLSDEQFMPVYFDDLELVHYRGRLLEETHYYPHGLLMQHSVASGAASENRYHYEGKELQDELGLQLYDFHARQYDPQIGRFWGVDPMDQFPSGYTGKGNDPVNLIDPTGMQTVGGGAPPPTPMIEDADIQRNYDAGGGIHNRFDVYIDGVYSGTVEDWFMGGEGVFLLGGARSKPSTGKGSNNSSESDLNLSETDIHLPEVKVVNHVPQWVEWIREMEAWGYKIIDKLSFLYQSGSIYSERHRNDDKRYNQYVQAHNLGYLPFKPDAVGISIPITANGLTGYSGSLNIGFVGDEFGIWYNGGVNVGTPELSLGFGGFMAEYKGPGLPTLESYMGYGRSHNGGFLMMSGGYSQGLDKYNGVVIWNTYQVGVGLSSREIIPGLNTTYNYSPVNYSQSIFSLHLYR